MKRGAKTATATLLFAFLITGLASPSLLYRTTRLVLGTVNAQSLNSNPQVPSEDEARRILARDLTTRLVELGTGYQFGGKAERAVLKEELRDLAARRRAMLAELIESDPGELLRVALPDDRREGLPSYIRDNVEQRVEIEGEFEALYQCGEQEARLSYFINTDGERLSLHFAIDPPEIQTGARVRVKGVRVGEAIAIQSGRDNLSASEGSSFETMAMAVAPYTFGEQKVLVLLVNFLDKTTQPWTIDQVRSLVFGTVNSFYQESSYQQTWLTGDVFGWYTLPINSTCDTSVIGTYARQTATAAGISFAGYSRIVYAYPSVSCGWTGSGQVGGNPSQCWINGSMTTRTVGHELGHNFGLYHARALDCGSQVIGGTCSYIEYGDTLDILGQTGVTAHSHANQKERLGWLNYGTSPGITTVQASGAYWIDPYESVGSNAKALKILKSTDPTTGRKTWYYVEFRRPIGFDSFISGNSNVMNGVMVHTGTEGYTADDYLLDMTPETSSFSDAALDVGRSYNDPNINVTITPISVSSTGASVNVSFGPQPCVQANPSMSLSPSGSQWVAAGSTLTFQVSVTNNDSAGCTASSFSLQVSVPTGWSAAFSNPNLSISPGASAAATLQVTAPTSAADGFYTQGMTASNSSNTSYSVSSSASCVIVSSLGVALSSAQSSYTRSQTATVTAIVSGAGSPVTGASVTFTMTKSNGSVVTGTATTGTNGSAVFSYRFNKKRDPAGTYGVSANANLNGIYGNGATSFVVQ
jgi:hypothetical protein